MRNLNTEIHIDAAPAKVWSILSDFAAYPEWNPMVTELTGDPTVGNQIAVTLNNGGKDFKFKPQVLTNDPEKEFAWKGKLLFKGLFDGHHYFRLEAQPDGTTKFIHGENFSGILVGLLMKKLEEPTRRGFIAMNEALKARAEQS